MMHTSRVVSSTRKKQYTMILRFAPGPGLSHEVLRETTELWFMPVGSRSFFFDDNPAWGQDYIVNGMAARRAFRNIGRRDYYFASLLKEPCGKKGSVHVWGAPQDCRACQEARSATAVGAGLEGYEMTMTPFDLSGKVAVVTGGNRGIGLGDRLGPRRSRGREWSWPPGTRKSPARWSGEIQEEGGEALAVNVDVGDESSVESLMQSTLEHFGAPGHSGQQRRHQYPQDSRETDPARVVGGAPGQPYRNLPLLPGGLPNHEEERRRGQDHQHRLDAVHLRRLLQPRPTAPAREVLVQLTKSLASAWAADGVQVNAILPGFIDTDLTRQGRRDVPTLHEPRLEEDSGRPLGHPEGTVRERPFFLASPASDFVTGAAIPVDGGFSMQVWTDPIPAADSRRNSPFRFSCSWWPLVVLRATPRITRFRRCGQFLKCFRSPGHPDLTGFNDGAGLAVPVVPLALPFSEGPLLSTGRRSRCGRDNSRQVSGPVGASSV